LGRDRRPRLPGSTQPPVDESREWFNVATRPERGPLVVAAATEDYRVLRRDERGPGLVHDVVPGREEPVGTVGDAVKRQGTAWRIELVAAAGS
jgi:hypothetical protein